MTRARRHLPSLGLTGGIGSGKSTALAYLQELGAAVISSDDIVHDLYSGGEVVERILEHFGDSVVDASGAVNRPALAAIVFADDDELRWLEDLLHPHVRAAVAAWADAQRAAPHRPALVAVEVPLLFETEYADAFDYTMLITAPEDVRRRRLSAKLTDSEFSRRLSQQLPEEEKAARSDFVFGNVGGRRELKEFVGQAVAAILAAPDPAAGGGADESPS